METYQLHRLSGLGETPEEKKKREEEEKKKREELEFWMAEADKAITGQKTTLGSQSSVNSWLDSTKKATDLILGVHTTLNQGELAQTEQRTQEAIAEQQKAKLEQAKIEEKKKEGGSIQFTPTLVLGVVATVAVLGVLGYLAFGDNGAKPAATGKKSGLQGTKQNKQTTIYLR